jgi:hypothetical protein
MSFRNMKKTSQQLKLQIDTITNLNFGISKVSFMIAVKINSFISWQTNGQYTILLFEKQFKHHKYYGNYIYYLV